MDEAIDHFQTVLEIKPDYAEANYNLGVALDQKGRVDEAIVQYQKALQIKPDRVDARVNLGVALFRKGNVDEAIGHFQKALQSEPDNANIHNSLGTAFLQKERVDEAIGHFQKALQSEPDSADAHYGLGIAFSKIGKMAEAITQYHKVLRIAPVNPIVQNNLAWLLATCPEASLRDGKEAVDLAHQANVLTGGEKPIILHTLAAAYAEAGRFSEAVETAQRALRFATAQGNSVLARQLQEQLKLYEAGMPFSSAH